jgi:hypothetical protein
MLTQTSSVHYLRTVRIKYTTNAHTELISTLITHCKHQYPTISPTATISICYVLHTAPAVLQGWNHNGQSTQYDSTKDG